MTAKQKANQARFKKVVAEAKKLRKKNPKLTQAQAVKQAWAMTYTKNKVAGYGKASKVGAVKKKSAPKKKAAKKSSSYHKDTKSHNVNIRVMSGVDNYVDRNLNQYKNLVSQVKEWTKKYKSEKDPGIRWMYKLKADRLKNEARERKYVLTNYLRELKKVK
jgi:hypothetical protein